MRILQLLLIGLPVAGLLVTGPAMSSPFYGVSLRSLSGSDRMIHEAGYRPPVPELAGRMLASAER